MLGDLEQLILLAVLRAGDDAYGVTIAAELDRHARRDVSLATIYKTLSRLEVKGFVHATLGDPTPARGGRAKRYYVVTPPGQQALRSAMASLTRMSAGLDLGLESR